MCSCAKRRIKHDICANHRIHEYFQFSASYHYSYTTRKSANLHIFPKSCENCQDIYLCILCEFVSRPGEMKDEICSEYCQVLNEYSVCDSFLYSNNFRDTIFYSLYWFQGNIFIRVISFINYDLLMFLKISYSYYKKSYANE